jgi:hypothetical protein
LGLSDKMDKYKCNNCLRTFTRNESLLYHISKSVCVSAQNKIQSDDDNECKFCGKTFTTPTSMYRHMNHTCKIKKSEDLKRDAIYERLLELEEKTKEIDELKKKTQDVENENKKLKKKVDSLEKNTHNVANVTNNNTQNINNGIVAHINLIGYGKEDLSKIDKKEILKAMQFGYDSTIKLTETLHFNPKHPEYHNIYITNVKDKYAMIFDGKEWNLTMKEDLINKIYDDKKNYIEENLDDFLDSLSSSRKKALERWLMTDDDDERINKVKNEIKLLLYNKRNLIMDKQDDTVPRSKNMVRVVKTKKRAKRALKYVALNNVGE